MTSYTRRSTRAITSVPSLYQTFQSGGKEQIPIQTKQEPEPEHISVSNTEPLPKSKNEAVPSHENDGNVGQPTGSDPDMKLRRSKVPKGIKKARRNKLLSRLIQPKPALMLLHELKPGLTFVVKDPLSGNAGTYEAQGIFEGRVLGTGHGNSKNGAKHKAAEMALRQIVKETIDDPSFIETMSNLDPSKTEVKDEQMDADEAGGDDDAETDTAYEKLPWASLASFALHRMFAEWKQEGVEIPAPAIKPSTGPTTNGTTTASTAAATSEEIKLPENANMMHPVSLLNQMHTAIRAEELQRTNAPNSSVTVGYRINGQLYTGTATNGKAARKIAATHACTAVYGVTFT